MVFFAWGVGGVGVVFRCEGGGGGGGAGGGGLVELV